MQKRKHAEKHKLIAIMVRKEDLGASSGGRPELQKILYSLKCSFKIV